jgi:hypothetical protein
MHHFFDKRATVVDITDKEVIDLFKDGLYHRRTFEDFGRRRPKSIPHLKDMITSWADEKDKANAMYDAIRGRNKQNAGGGRGTWTATTLPSSATNSGEHSRVLQSHCTLTTRRARRRTMETTTTSRNPTRLSTSSSADYPADGSKKLLVEKS